MTPFFLFQRKFYAPAQSVLPQPARCCCETVVENATWSVEFGHRRHFKPRFYRRLIYRRWDITSLVRGVRKASHAMIGFEFNPSALVFIPTPNQRGISRRGLFITFEGPEGSGKSTQLRMLAERLRGLGRQVLETAEPGGTPIGLQIRRVLLDSKNSELRPIAELLLMFAARAQNIDQWILPALSKGNVVLCDRFTDSTLVYQGVARGLGSELVYEVDRIACRGLIPDLTLVIDIDVETGLARAKHRDDYAQAVETRMEEQTVSFHSQVRDAYRRLAEDEPRRVRLIDGDQRPDDVAEQVWRQIEPSLEAINKNEEAGR